MLQIVKFAEFKDTFINNFIINHLFHFFSISFMQAELLILYFRHTFWLQKWLTGVRKISACFDISKHLIEWITWPMKKILIKPIE